MPLGSALKTKIDIDYTRAQGVASTGRILFQPTPQKVGTTMVSGLAVPVTLVSGVATVDLVRLPEGTYKAIEQLDGIAQRSFDFLLPPSSADIVQYEDIVPIPVPDEYEPVSILTSIKKALGLAEDYTAFDTDVIMHINSALNVLNQLGVGPSRGFRIQDKDSVWSEFTDDDNRLNMVESYTFLYVRLLFDPPGNSFAVKAIEEQKKELEWRINLQREEEIWTEPTR